MCIRDSNNIDSPGPGIPVIRALKESERYNVRIIGLSYETLEPGIYMRDLVDKTYQIPMPTAGTHVLLERLKYINAVSYTHLRAHETVLDLVCRLLLEKKKHHTPEII